MKVILIIILVSILATPVYGAEENNNLEFEFGISYNYHPYLDNITEDIKGENAYLNQNKFNLFNIPATTDAFTKLEYSLGFNSQMKYWLLDVLAVGGEIERVQLKSSYRAEKDDEHDSYYLQQYKLSSSGLLAKINLRPFGQRTEDLIEQRFWQRLIFDFNLAGGVYYHQFVRSYDLDLHHNNYHYSYDQEDKYDGVSPGFKGGVELTYLINKRSRLTLGANYNKIFAQKLTDQGGEGYRSIYSDDYREEEFDFTNYGFYFNLLFNL